MKKSVLIGTILLLVSNLLHSQVSGNVGDKNGAFPGIQILINDSIKASTDLDGYFIFSQTSGTVKISFVGYPIMPKIELTNFPIDSKMNLKLDMPILKEIKTDIEEIPQSEIVVDYEHSGREIYYHKNRIDRDSFNIYVNEKKYTITDNRLFFINGIISINWKTIIN